MNFGKDKKEQFEAEAAQDTTVVPIIIMELNQ